jgi:hypothetical protein
MANDLPFYAELHCCSNFSFLRGASHPEELVERAQDLGYGALALTDEASLAGVVRAHKAASARGLKLIIGADFRLASQQGPGFRLVLLAQNRAGYGNLSALITLARRRSCKGEYRLLRGDLETPGQITGGSGAVPDCLALWIPGPGASADEGRWLATHFPARSWLAIELHAGANDAARLSMLLELATASGLPAVATGDVHMHLRARRPLQDTLTAIRLNSTLFAAGHGLFANGERHLRSRLRLARIYPPELLAETLRIAARCNFSLDELHYQYPEEVVPDGQTPSAFLRAEAEKGLRQRYSGSVPASVRERVEHELALIGELSYESYFLTVYDIVNFARSRNILCQGARLGGQLGSLLQPWHYGSRSGTLEPPFRALHLPRARRATRYRRRFRTCATRGSHPVSLCQVRARARRTGRGGGDLPYPRRPARRWPRPRLWQQPDRRPHRFAGLVGQTRATARSPARRRSRSRRHRASPNGSSWPKRCMVFPAICRNMSAASSSRAARWPAWSRSKTPRCPSGR